MKSHSYSIHHCQIDGQREHITITSFHSSLMNLWKNSCKCCIRVMYLIAYVWIGNKWVLVQVMALCHIGGEPLQPSRAMSSSYGIIRLWWFKYRCYLEKSNLIPSVTQWSPANCAHLVTFGWIVQNFVKIWLPGFELQQNFIVSQILILNGKSLLRLAHVLGLSKVTLYNKYLQ